jgi:hypothetical protein
MTKKLYVSKTRRKELLADLGYTEEQMDAFWNDAKEFNFKVSALSGNGIDWRNLTEDQMVTVPSLRRIHEAYIAEQKKKEEDEKFAKELDELIEDKKLKDNDFEQWSLNAITNGTELEDDDISDMIDAFEVEDYRSYGDNRRWSRTISSILEIKGRYFQVDWEQGLTECQNNSYCDRPFEVTKHEYQKTITVTEWLKK